MKAPSMPTAVRRSMLLIVLSLFAIDSFAQSTYLTIRNRQRAKVQRIYPGDAVKLQSQDFNIKGVVEVVRHDYIQVNGTKMEYHRIEKFTYYKPILMQNGVKIMGAGVLLAGIVTFNGLINNDDPILDKGTAIISAVAVGLGAALFKFGIVEYKMNDKRYFEVIDVSNLAEPKP
jgi:hypothetical protein